MKIITNEATIFDENGYIQAQGVEVCDHVDTISIGHSEYPKHEINLGEKEITSNVAEWTVRF